MGVPPPARDLYAGGVIRRGLLVAGACAVLAPGADCAGGVGFSDSLLDGSVGTQITALQFGPDGRLWVAHLDGTIRAYDVERAGPNDYRVAGIETIDLVRHLPNHDDDGTPSAEPDRLLTGMLVAGTAASPIVYAASSDPRISVGIDSGLDTNSGILSRLTRDGGGWRRDDLLRGLPRSEENHGPNGMALDADAGILYLAQGGNTNMGAPSSLFSGLPEYALSAAILAIDLAAIEGGYDLPTLDDPTRPNTGPGGADEGDPFGGNDGLNQAILEASGPVWIHAPGFRNCFDLLRTEAGRLWAPDNGGNPGWGGPPLGEGPAGRCSNGVNDAPTAGVPDGLHRIGFEGYYGGHPNPTRASQANVFGGQSPVPWGNPIECESLLPGENDAQWWWDSSTNGIAEYRATNFDGAMTGDLLVVLWNLNRVDRVLLDAAGTTVIGVETLFTEIGLAPLDVTAPGPGDPFVGTIWVADHPTGDILVYEPFDGVGCTAADDPGLDEDGDGYDNATELALGTNPCSPASVPADHDGDLLPDAFDDDDDDDGWPDATDPFAIDPLNGTAQAPPLDWHWALGNPGTGLLGLGFTGVMTNGIDPWHDLHDPASIIAGGAAGKLTIEAVGPGDALGAANDQRDALQAGVAVSAATGPFEVWTRIEGPLFDGRAPAGREGLGLFVGSGDQDHYLRLSVAAFDGAAGIEVVHEESGVPLVARYAADLRTAASVELSICIDPAARRAQPRYAIDGGRWMPAGPPIAFEGLLAAAVAGPAPLAFGVIATSAEGSPFTATWDGIAVSLLDADAEARLRIDPPGENLENSTFSPESFEIVNTAPPGLRIESVVIDLSTAWFPDLVFDPLGTGGDLLAKPFTPDEGATATGYASHELIDPRDGGWRSLAIHFSHFDPGESFSFSIDVDPTSIQGEPAPGPGGSGHISGLELGGASVVVTFDDGTTLAACCVPEPDELDASEAHVRAGAPAPPGLSATNGATSIYIASAMQSIRVTGPPGAAVGVARSEGGLFVVRGGHDVGPFEANRALDAERIEATIGPDGTVEIPVVLLRSLPEGGIHRFTAWIESAEGPGATAPPLVMQLVDATIVARPAALDLGTTTLGAPIEGTVTLTRTTMRPVVVAELALIGDADFSLVDPPATPFVLDEDLEEIELTARFTTTVAGPAFGAIRLLHDGPSAVLEIPLFASASANGILYRVNVGGPEVPATDGGPAWLEDQTAAGFTGGTSVPGIPSPFVNDQSNTYGSLAPVALDGSVPPDVPTQLFQTNRWDPNLEPEMRWSFPVPAGTRVEARIFVAEIFPIFTDPGDRVFDVRIEGDPWLTGLDAVAAAGPATGLMRGIARRIDDGALSLRFEHFVENPMVSAIEVRVLPPCPADLDDDGETGLGDLLVVLARWGDADDPADLSGNGIVDFADLVAVLTAWGPCPD